MDESPEEDLFEEFRAELEADPSAGAGLIRAYLSRFAGDPEARRQLAEQMADQHLFTLVYSDRPVPMEDYSGLCPEFLTPDDLLKLRIQWHLYEADHLKDRKGLKVNQDPADENLPPPIARHPRFRGFRGWRPIGAGQNGQVWYAVDPGSKKEFAVKVIPAAGMEAECRQRLLGEAEAAAGVQHPNVCQVYEAGGYEGVVYILMGYVRGPRLDEWTKERGPSVRDLTLILSCIAEGLHAAHQKGVVHRDLKPANVIIEEETDRPVVVDFGHATPFTANDPGPRDGRLAGSLAVMAPEQVPEWLAPGARGPVSPRTDVFALGATFYALRLGYPPFGPDGGSLPEVAGKIVHQPPVFTRKEIGQTTSEFRAICLRAMAKQPGERYQTAKQMAEDLLACHRGDPLPHARLPTYLGRLRNAARKRRRTLLWVITALLVLGVGILYGRQRWRTLERDELVGGIRSALAAGEIDRAEDLLVKLEHLDPERANDEVEKLIDTLLHLDRPSAGGSLTPEDLGRLNRAIVRLAGRDPGRAASLRRADRWERFRSLAPYSQTGSLFFFVKPDPDRVAALEQVVSIAERLSSGTETAGVKQELLRAYFVAGDLHRAKRVAEGLLDGNGLSPTWRMTILRDYVWLAIQLSDQTGDPEPLGKAKHYVESSLRGRRPECLSLLVEQAHLLAAEESYLQAEQALNEYFGDEKKGKEGTLRIDFDSDWSDESRPEGAPPDNVKVLFFLDASLLRGFLLERRAWEKGAKPEEVAKAQQDAKSAWEYGFVKVRGAEGPAKAYYEAAVLGSLCDELGFLDATFMALRSASGANFKRDSPVAAGLEKQVWKAVPFVTTVLRKAWQSPRGQEYARRIAFRRLSFGEFTHTHFRLWLFEGLRLAVASDRGELSAAQDQLVWQLVQDAHSAYAARRLSEDAILDLVSVGMGQGGYTKWREAAAKLPAELRGPIAYVLARQYRLNLDRRDEAALFLGAAQNEAGSVPPRSPLRALVEAEMEPAEK
jgi:hypothetical protein